MPHFYFDHTSDGITTCDEVGLDFSSLEDAYLDVCRAALDMGYEKLRCRCDPHRDAIDILDNERRPLMHVPFSEVLGRHPRLLRAPRTENVQQCIDRSRTLRAKVQLELQKVQSSLHAIREQLARAQRLARRD